LLQRPTVRPHALARSIITALKGLPEFKKYCTTWILLKQMI